MSDLLLDLLAVVFAAFALVDLYVLYRLIGPTRQHPRIDALTTSTVVVATVATGGVIGAILGLNSVWRQLTGNLILSPEITLLALVVALGAPSAGCVYLWRQLRRWGSAQRRAIHTHARGADHETHLHRRSTDVGPSSPDSGGIEP